MVGGYELEEIACTIRRATPADAAALAGLAVRTFRDTYEASNRPEDMAAYLARCYGPAQQLAEITSPDVLTLLADRDGLAAFAQVRPGRLPACVTFSRSVEVWRFYVDRAWHGRGVAQQLMQAVIAEAAARVAAVWLGVWEHNPRAIAFYRKFGFVDVGPQEFRFGTAVQTDRVMMRSFGPG